MASVEASIRAVLSRLDAEDYNRSFELFYVDGRNDMERLTGSPVTGYSYYRDDAVVLVFNDRWRAFERHELTHVVTLRTWGRPAGASAVEGVATFVDGKCGSYDNARIARTILDRGDLLELQLLVDEFRAQDDLVAYLQASALFEFMHERLGASVLRSLWTEGLGNAPGLLGVTEGEFEQQFRQWLSSDHSPIPDAAWQQIRIDGCGITVGAAG